MITQSLNVGDAEARCVFIGTNTGNASLAIEKVSANCDCTTATANTHNIPPAGTVRVETVFTIDDRVGAQRKRITVDTDAGKSVLFFQVNIPKVVEITPKFIFWRKGEIPSKKTVTVHLLNDYVEKITTVTSDDARFDIAFSQDETNTHTYHINVTRRSTAEHAKANLSVNVVCHGERILKQTIHAHIK